MTYGNPGKLYVARCPLCKLATVKHILRAPKYQTCGDKRCLLTSCIKCDRTFQVRVDVEHRKPDTGSVAGLAAWESWPIARMPLSLAVQPDEQRDPPVPPGFPPASPLPPA